MFDCANLHVLFKCCRASLLAFIRSFIWNQNILFRDRINLFISIAQTVCVVRCRNFESGRQEIDLFILAIKYYLNNWIFDVFVVKSTRVRCHVCCLFIKILFQIKKFYKNSLKIIRILHCIVHILY